MKSALSALAAVGVALGALATVRAYAGEPNAMGCMFTADGGSINNATTGYNIANQNIRAFTIPTNALITLQCRDLGACQVAVGESVTDAGRGLYIPANGTITSSTGSATVRVPMADGGFYTGAVISMVQAAGATSGAHLCVFARKGNE